MRWQAVSPGLGDRFEGIGSVYAGGNRPLGLLVEVTSSSRGIGDFAMAPVGPQMLADTFADDLSKLDIADSLIGSLRGEQGAPPGGGTAAVALDGRAAHHFRVYNSFSTHRLWIGACHSRRVRAIRS